MRRKLRDVSLLAMLMVGYVVVTVSVFAVPIVLAHSLGAGVWSVPIGAFASIVLIAVLWVLFEEDL